ncbi:MAG: hypothetical protein ACREPM_07170 [Gemmatimonadaceae bacterium]
MRSLTAVAGGAKGDRCSGPTAGVVIGRVWTGERCSATGLGVTPSAATDLRLRDARQPLACDGAELTPAPPHDDYNVLTDS